MSRKNARESVFKLVFEYVFNKEEDLEFFNQLIEENKTEESYIKEVYYGVINHYDDLCDIIAKNASGFSFNRLFKVDLAILLVAIYEVKFMENIPHKVSINEALNLAKLYSTEKSNKFINGILATVVK